MEYKKPTVLVAGFPRSGSTYLYHLLKQHPDIYIPQIKEINYFNKGNIRNMQSKIDLYKKGEISFTRVHDSHKGWQAYAKWANCHNLNNKIKRGIIDILWEKF